MFAGKRLVEVGDRSLQYQLAAARHRVTSVHRQVHNDLVELSGVGLDNRRGRSGQEDDFKIVSHERTQQLTDFLQPLVQVKHLWLHRLPAAESQQLPGQRRAALRRFLDVVDIFLGGGVDAGSQQFRTRRHNSEQVVEVVRDSAGQAAHGLHFLRLPELVLDFFSVP